MDTPPKTTPATPITIDYALGEAARVLHEAELHPHHVHVMERLEKIADSWTAIANTLIARERT